MKDLDLSKHHLAMKKKSARPAQGYLRCYMRNVDFTTMKQCCNYSIVSSWEKRRNAEKGWAALE